MALPALLRLVLLVFAAPTPAHATPTPVLMMPKDLEAQYNNVVVIDARSYEKYEKGHIPGAISLPWVDMAQMPKSPKLRPVSELAALLESKALPANRRWVVYGDGRDGWGEEGRLWWTLAYLGHANLALLDGGVPAWLAAGYVTDTVGPDILDGRFRPRPVNRLRIELPELRAAVVTSKVQVLDVRDEDEFGGSRKFGEPRGGHIPGAANLPWKQLLDEDGRMLPVAKLRKLFASRGLQPGRPVVVYCTGGVRSGYAFVALLAAGYRARNYDGSFWEWASDASLPVEGAAAN